MSKLMGTKGTSRTDVYFVTYDEDTARRLVDVLMRNYDVIKYVRSRVVKELYYISIRGRVDKIRDYLSSNDKISWYKVDFIEFR
ncbi:MAG TPA: hypothetical protein ENG05_00935 [Acidilobales archaeon]|nr:hypothetical protein [Acidilobales archaeon]